MGYSRNMEPEAANFYRMEIDSEALRILEWRSSLRPAYGLDICTL